MIDVSSKWKKSLGCMAMSDRPDIVPESYIKIEYEQIDTDAQSVATATSSDKLALSDMSDVVSMSSNYETRIATLELNQWVLDSAQEFKIYSSDVVPYSYIVKLGTMNSFNSATFLSKIGSSTGSYHFTYHNLFTDANWYLNGVEITDPLSDYGISFTLYYPEGLLGSAYRGDFTVTTESAFVGDTGYVSASLSNADGTFTTHPIVNIDLSSVATAQLNGIYMQWSSVVSEYASDFLIYAYNGSTLITTYTFKNSKPIENNSVNLINYDKLVVEITKWCLPYHRARLENLLLGFKASFEKSNLISYKHFESGDLFSFTIPDSGVTFEIDNVEGEWNPDNTTGYYTFLLERQPVKVYYQYDLDGIGKQDNKWKLFGTYFMSEWSTPQNGISTSFTARSLLDFATIKYTPTSGTYTYAQLAQSAWTQAGMPNTQSLQIANTLLTESIVIDASNFGEYTCAEIIQLCANAGKTVISYTTNGDVVLHTITSELSDYFIDPFVSYSFGEYDISKQLKSISVNNGLATYTVSSSGEVQSIQNELITDASYASGVADWIADLLSKRKTITGEWRADVRLQPYDEIKVENKYAVNVVYVTNVDYDYTGTFKGTYEGRVLRSIAKADMHGEYYVGDTYSGGEF